MGTLADLATRMQALAKSLPQQASDIATQAGTAIVVDLILNTPVDTSKALSNWVVSLGDANGNRLPPYVPGKAGSTAGASQAEAVAAAYAILRNKAPGQVIWISNNLPYIQRLNEGYSLQQPAGFVERAELIGGSIIKRANIRG